VPQVKVPTPARPQLQQNLESSALPGTLSKNKEQLADRPTHQQQVPSPQRPDNNRAPGRTQEQMARNSMAPLAPGAQSRQISSVRDLDELPTNHLSIQQTNGQNGSADAPTMNLHHPESFATNGEAAEYWRKSWRDRQYAEAGPAEKVSRGDASVPMPLMAMQHSFARMRAIVGIHKQQNERKLNFASWITIFLMICLIGGLGAYIISTYLPNSLSLGATHVVPPANAPQPLLTLQGIPSQTVLIGQTIHLHGEHFGANDTITFLLDTTTPIKDARGNQLTTQANSQGAFDETFHVAGSDWTTGSHSIEAHDSNNLYAYLPIQVIPAGTPTKTSNELSVTMNDKPVSLLKFTAVIGQDKPLYQPITITNISGAPLKWSARAIADLNLSWLNINDNDNYGQLDIQQPHTMLISVNIAGLESAKQPYTGQIVFTINDNQQLTVPVQLQIMDTTPEMVFSPDPIIAHVGPGGTCQPGVTLTLINLGTTVIIWTVNPDDTGKIKFVDPATGQPPQNHQLQPSGLDGDTQVLSLQCSGVQVGHQYPVSVYANQTSWSELVIIQP
jgi:hypothetical protein